MFRSLLFVPGHAEKFLAKAHERDADAVILDLEDGVPPACKDTARRMLATTVPAVGRSGAAVFVRINPAGSPEFEADVDAAEAAGAFGLFVPKTSEKTLIDLDALLDRLEARSNCTASPLRLALILEDAAAVLDARAIARASRRTLALAIGSEDLATHLGALPTAETLRLPHLLMHLAAKAEGLLSFGMFRSIADYQDRDAVAAAAAEARAHGFDGACCVHPAVVPILNAAFAPSADEVEHARRVVGAFEFGLSQGDGAVVLDGAMIDLPIAERARRVLAMADRYASRPPTRRHSGAGADGLVTSAESETPAGSPRSPAHGRAGTP